jgi:iron complex outermembrane receptor protein
MKKQLLLMLVFIPAIAFAQFKITGKVKDKETGEPMAGAHVILQERQIKTITDINGIYTFSNIRKGEYTVSVSYVGYATKVSEINVENNVTLDVKLEPTQIFGEEVIISAIRATDESPTTYTIMDQAQIETRNNGKDLPYIFKYTPSVVVTSDAGAGVGYTGMRIRGTDLTGINVTLNGVPVNDGESQTVYFVDLPDLASSINDVQIQRGVGTSTNGAASFGASININTSDANPEPHAMVSSMAGSFNTFKNTAAFGTGNLESGWNFNGRLSSITSDGYVDRASSDLKSAYLGASYADDNNIFKAVALLGKEKTYQAWYGVPKDSLETNPTYNPAGEMYDSDGNFIGYYENQTDNYNQNYYQLHYARKFSKKLNAAVTGFLTTGKGYYESYKNDEDFADYGMPDTIIGNDTITSTNLIRQKWLDNKYYGINLSANYNASKLGISFGGGWNKYDGDHYGKIVWAQVMPLTWIDKDWYFNKGIKTEFNFFAKASYYITGSLIAYADMQYRNINYTIEGTHDDLGDLTQQHTFSFFNPKGGVLYNFNPRNSIYISVGIANREPNRSVYRDADPGQVIKPERLTDYELGYKLQLSKFQFETNLYYMNYKDQFVQTGKINNVGTAIMTNVDKSYRVGIELMASASILTWLDWSANATFSQNKILDFTSYVDDWTTWSQREKYLGTTDISFSPGIIASNNFMIKPVNNLQISLLSSYIGRQYIDNTSDESRSLDPYLVNNIDIHYTIETRLIPEIDFRLSLNNIFNEKYETNAWVYRYYYDDIEYEMNGYFPQAGFNFMAGVSVGF